MLDPEAEDTDTPARAMRALQESREKRVEADSLIAASSAVVDRLREQRRRPDYLADKLRVIIRGGRAA